MGFVCLSLAATGAAQDWSGESALPKTASNSSCVGGVPNNMATLSTGRTYIAYKETVGMSAAFKVAWTDDSGATWGGPLLFNPQPGIPVAGLPSVVADATDQLHFSWSSGAAVHHVRLDPTTHTFGDYEQIAAAGTVIGFNQITADRAGGLHVIWHTGDATSTTEAAEVWYARRVAGASSFDAPVRLSADDGIHSAFPSLDCTGADGTLLAVAWRDAAGTPFTPGMDWNIIIRVSTNGGAAWTPQQVLASGSDRQFDPI